ncbi:MAG: cobaltochelatase subunit CobN [Hyphomicrobiales bacterium]
MHILATTSGAIDGGSEAVDLAQTPGDIVVISAADSELACLARAHDALPEPKPSLRLANLMALGHNFSVDLYLEKTVAHAKVCVVRCLGGESYWPYGIAELTALSQRTGMKLVLLPGGTEADPALTARSTVAPAEAERLRRYFAAGGIENAKRFLAGCAHLMGQGEEPPPAEELPRAGLYADTRSPGKPAAAIVFYRALIEGGLTPPVDALIAALADRGVGTAALYVQGLKDAASVAFLAAALELGAIDVALNATAFAVGGDNPLSALDCPVLQVVFSGSGEEAWAESAQGLSPRDLAMNIVLPEFDGRIATRAVSFKDGVRHEPTQSRVVTYRPVPDRIAFVADLAANWMRLRRTPAHARRIAVVLANYPNRDGRIGNGVGYDTPASTVAILNALGAPCPDDPNALIEALQEGPTNRDGARAASSRATLPLSVYERFLAALPEENRRALNQRWGEPARDPFCREGAFHLPVTLHGNAAVMIQPARGYNIDPKETYHSPDLVPPHGYLAAYLWLRETFGAQAIVHNGKHGNLEWLPGKANALSRRCWPEIALGPVPQVYPFIVNDPGEGAQGKRRTGAVIVDHLTPPLARAETYGRLRDLEVLIDEYYQAMGLDRRRQEALRRDILELLGRDNLAADAGIDDTLPDDEQLQRLDAWLCDVKESQIRNGLHVLGSSPRGRLEAELIVALTRLPRGDGASGEASILRALSNDLGLAFDPLSAKLSDPWTGAKPPALKSLSSDAWRTAGDTVERLELLALALVDGKADAPGPASAAVLAAIDTRVRPAVAACGPHEIDALLKGLAGRFVPPGPSGAPTRGRLDVLPTGRNFFSLDNRTLPTPTAWDIGRRSADAMLERHFQEHGRYPAAMGLSVWGTSNMRTGGDDIAQALALIGARPVWEPGTGRVTGFETIPPAKLGRPRIDVTLRISGFFRDAFPAQIELFDKAARAIGALDEPAEENPIAARMAAERRDLLAAGVPERDAAALSGHRIFGSAPGAYGAGLQAMIDEKLWDTRADLARAYVTWGSYAYGSSVHGAASPETFAKRLRSIEAVVHNQDNREHDLLDSDDYYQFEGGMTAAVEAHRGERPVVWHNDHSRPERPQPRTLEEEISRVMRARVVNPKWIEGVMRHGYKGAFEIAATVDYMFAFAATTGAVKPHHFDLAYDAFLADERVRTFLERNNPAALKEMADRFEEAIERGLWTPRSNAAWREVRSLNERAIP